MTATPITRLQKIRSEPSKQDNAIWQQGRGYYHWPATLAQYSYIVRETAAEYSPVQPAFGWTQKRIAATKHETCFEESLDNCHSEKVRNLTT